MRLSHWALLPALPALLASAGCESKSIVTGTVTFEGKKLAEGYITFYPATEHGAMKGAKAETKGAPIVDGSFTMENLSPGKRKVVISIPAKLVEQKGADASKLGVKALPPAHPIPMDAPGNSRVVDIATGSQTLDFALHKK